jgi:hypothetical protein
LKEKCLSLSIGKGNNNNLKKRDMSIGRRNSGFVKQDGIIAGFGKEARTAASGSDAVAVAMGLDARSAEKGIKDKRAEYAAAQALKLASSPRMSINAVTGKKFK